jgi:hypothetical protein
MIKRLTTWWHNRSRLSRLNTRRFYLKNMSNGRWLQSLCDENASWTELAVQADTVDRLTLRLILNAAAGQYRIYTPQEMEQIRARELRAGALKIVDKLQQGGFL